MHLRICSQKKIIYRAGCQLDFGTLGDFLITFYVRAVGYRKLNLLGRFGKMFRGENCEYLRTFIHTLYISHRLCIDIFAKLIKVVLLI